MNQDKKISPVAIIGLSCLFPKAPGMKEYWRLVYQGEDAITDVPESHWNANDYYSENPKTQDHTYCTRGGYLLPVPFNPAEFGLPPSILEATDTSQILGLVASKMALNDAGYGKDREFDRDRVSVMLGATVTQELVISMGSRLGHPKWRRALEDSGIPPEKVKEVMERISDSYAPWQESTFPGLLGNVISGRIANRFDFGGVNTTLDAACASSFSALNLAFMEIQSGKSDMVLTGGVDTLNDIFMHMCFAQTGVLSHTGSVKAFSDKADGTVIGEGIGIVILKKLEQAEKDGDKIYAVIRSVGGSSDGKSLSIYAPSAKGQAKAIQRAYDQAGISPATVELLEAHGTGTRGDVVEFQGLTQVFSKHSDKKNWCALGTVKSNIGHTKASAGVAGLIKGVLSLYHKVLPPTLNIDTPDPKMNIKDSPFYLCTESRPWLTPQAGHPRRCGVTACGFGGSNFHVILEEYVKDKKEVSWDGAVEILAFSGQSESVILRKIEAFKKEAVLDKPLYMCDAFFHYHASVSRNAFQEKDPIRLLLIIGKDDIPTDKLDKAVQGLHSDTTEALSRQNIFLDKNPAAKDGLAFLFPGQGSQYTHMGKDIINVFPEAREVLEKINAHFDQADTRLSDIIYPLPDHIQDRKTSEDALRKTDKAQPSIGAISLAMNRVLGRFGVTPQATCGHSYGELSALCSAGWLPEDDFLTLSVARGKFMAACGDKAGTMLAVKAPLDDLDHLVKTPGLNVVLANRNSYDQGVLSGSFESIEKAEGLCKEKGYRTTRLPVAAAFHSSLVEAAAKPFGKEVRKHPMTPTPITVYSNTTGEPYPASKPKDMETILGNQLLNPVRFVDNIENMYKSGIRTFVEVGPKPVLNGLVSSILKDRPATILSLDASSGKKFGLIDLARTLCSLAVTGYPVSLSSWEQGMEKPEKMAMNIPICGANYRNPVKPRPKTTMALPQAPIAPRSDNLMPEAPKSFPVKAENALPEIPVQGTSIPGREMKQNNMTQPKIVNDALNVVQEGLRSMQAIQAQTAQAHNRFLEAQAEAGKTLQAIMEKAQHMIRNQGSSSSYVADMPPAPVRQTVQVQETPSARPMPAPMPAPVQRKAPPAPAKAPQAFVSPKAKDTDMGMTKHIETLMLGVVSDLTGYPVDMIGLDMDIEADLGIDSIKRVEIMSEFEERMPDLPPISPDAMSTMKTLGAIVAHVTENITESNGAAPAMEASIPSDAIHVDMEKLTRTMLAVVSDLTGYPVEMIGLDMDIEADLGIDSIKRVEIMSEFEERMPDMPPISPDAMATMKTLGAIVAHINENGSTQKSTLTGRALPPTETIFIDLDHLTRTMLDVVSDLTGYPVDMIGLDMDIEADLGIDSIKRVEIMSEFEERMPHLPPVSPDAMGTMKTLGAIVAHVADNYSAPETLYTEQATPSIETIFIDLDQLTRTMLEVVSDLTGYPVDMVGLDMDIEADLGIDSIKRVEIMSEFEERMPDMPPVSPEAMATMKTLGAIVAHIAENCSAPETDHGGQFIEPSKAITIDMAKLTRTMLEVVSDLTGYPVDMVGLDMDIEADLGIDSIKRVEIMSEFEERMPHLPPVSPEAMASMKTLEQICDYISSNGSSPAPVKSHVPEIKPRPEEIKPSVSRQIVRVKKTRINKDKPLAIPKNKIVYVTDDKSGLGNALVVELKNRHLNAQLIPIDGKTPDAAGLVIIPEFKKKRSGALSNLPGFKKKDHDIWDTSHDLFLKQAFELAHQAGSALMESSDQGGAFFATITRMDGTFGFSGGKLEAPILGGLSGLPKTAAWEWPSVSCKAIDIDTSTKVSNTLAQSLVDEFLHRGPVEVGYSESYRYSLNLEPSPVVPASFDLKPKDLVIVTGGAKGVTAATAIALAEKSQATIVLVGRSAEPGPEPEWLSSLTDVSAIKKAIIENEFKGQKATPAQVDKIYKTYMGNREVVNTITRLKAAGSTTVYLSANVRDQSAIQALVNTVTSSYGPVKALIHGAGVLEDRLIVDQTPEQFEHVYGTKVRGLENLLQCISPDDLNYLVLFSSVSARIGNSGQVAYAMANEVLNKVGRHHARQHPHCHVISINWGPWDGGMVTDSLKKEFARKHVELIPLDQGAQCMIDEMGGTLNQDIEVVIGGTFPTEHTDASVVPEPLSETKSSNHLSLSFKKEVDIHSYPILSSHIINKKPVVPFALMTEWFGHGALHKNPGFVLHGLDGMRVLKGIKIDKEPKTISLMASKMEKNGSFFEVELEILNGKKESGHIHSKAKAILTETLPQAPVYTIPPEILSSSYPRDLNDAYETILFHGPQLKGLKKILGCSSRGMAADVSSAPSPSAWITDPLRSNWVTDPLVLDSAYQMAILWCYEEKGLVSLPSYSASYRQYCRTFPQEGMTVVMEVKDITDHKMKSDFTFLDNQNKVVATISGYEAVMDESLMQTFGKDDKHPEGPLFDRTKLLAYAIGKPSEAFGKPYEVFDHDRIIARLPGPPYFFMDSVNKIDHTAWELKAGGWIESEYTVPADEWYFKANRSDKMPFCVLLEIALQPCGWLAAYAGSALHSDKQLKFRNLGGKAILTKEIDRDSGTLTMRTRMTKVSEAAGMIIEDFDIQILQNGETIYDGNTNFGFFTNETMEQQVGIRNPEKIVYTPTAEELKKARSLDFKKEVPLTPDDPASDPCPAVAMPSKALLMIDGIECYIQDGGPQGLGYVRGYKTVDIDEWFFKAHFFQDPVCPGSLGIESFLQLVKFAALERFSELKDTHRFEFTTGIENEWLYRGQVIPRNKKVEVSAIITQVTQGDAPEITADGYLQVDGLLIYQMKNFGIRLTPITNP